MIRIPTSKARKDFADILEAAKKGERFLLHKHNKGVAAIVSVQDLAILQAIEDCQDSRAADAAIAEIEAMGSVPWETVKKDLGL